MLNVLLLMFACQRERALQCFLNSNHIEYTAENTLLGTITARLYDFIYFAGKLLSDNDTNVS